MPQEPKVEFEQDSFSLEVTLSSNDKMPVTGKAGKGSIGAGNPEC